MAATGIRDYLRSKGLNDSDITYNNGTVMAKGQRFMDATPQSDGSTYADSKALDSAYNDYDVRSQLAQLRNRQPNPEQQSMMQALKDRVSKPTQQFSYDQNNDPLYKNALEAAQRGAQTATNNATVQLGRRGIGNSQSAVTAANSIQQKAIGDVNSNVLPQLAGQAWQRYQGQQQQDNQQTGQMMQLASMYDNQDQKKFSELAQALGLQQGYNQQQFQNDHTMDQAALQKQQANLGAASTVGQQLGRVLQPKDDWSNLYNQDGAPQNLQGRDQALQETQLNAQLTGKLPDGSLSYAAQQEALKNTAQYAGMYNGQPTMQKIMQNATIQNMTADNLRAAAAEARSVGKDDIALKMDIWEKTGQAPAGIPGVTAGSSLAGKTKTPLSVQDAQSILLKTPFITDETTTDRSGVIHKTGKTKIDKPGLVQAIAGLGMTDDQMDALFNLNGISEDEVKAIAKKLDDERKARGN